MRLLLRLLGVILLLPLLAALAMFIVANGLTRSTLALASLPALVVLLCFFGHRRNARYAALAILILDIAYCAFRIHAPSSTAPRMQYCERGDCHASPPLLSRLVDEGETALAGLTLSSALGFIGGDEQRALESLLRRDYGRLRTSPRSSALPNAVLIAPSTPQDVRYLAWVPPGRTNTPCVVFLHGFGGHLSVYLRALMDDGLADDFAIVAPFYSTEGAWASPDGREVVRTLVTRYLPPSVDRQRVYLVGLSNGAVGAARIAQDRSMRSLFRGTVLLSGAAASLGPDLTGTALLAITGRDDPRFALDAIEHDVDSLRAHGADVDLEILPGDHFIVLSRAPEVDTRIRTWITAHTP